MTKRKITRRSFVSASALAVVTPLAAKEINDENITSHQPLADKIPFSPKPFELEETTIADLQRDLQSGRYTARRLVEEYTARIRELDPPLRSVLEINPDALSIADALDRERKAKGARSQLHGIPVLIKDNIATADKMQTTAGSLALVGAKPARDAFLVERLRAAGAVILGKTNLSEWANFRSTHSSSGWSGRGRQCRNPYALDRTPSGSSSGTGVAVAANLTAIGIGTETDGSILSPSSINSLVGIKPTVGLISRAGIIPIAHSQDTAGPMTRTVRDAAILLGAMTGVDARDEATAASQGKSFNDYTQFLDPNGLKGARIGIARTKFFGYNAALDKVCEEAIAAMRSHGAEIIDPANIETAGQFDDAELDVLLFEFKADLNRYLAELPNSPARTLKDLIAFNERNREREMPYFGQELFIQAEAKAGLDSEDYKRARSKCIELARAKGIDATLAKYKLDAIIAPTGAPAWTIDLINGDANTGSSTTPAAVAGYPSVTVPAGFVFGLPVGISFFGAAWSEPKLIKLAYAFEQATKARRAPQFRASAQVDL
jgi:amidase